MEGRISNQHPQGTHRLNGECLNIVTCERCRRLFPMPQMATFQIKDKFGDTCAYALYVYHPEDDHWIYPSSCGYSVCYCSRYCRDKHNHRFNRHNATTKE